MTELTLIKFAICLIILFVLWFLSSLLVRIKSGLPVNLKLNFKAENKYIQKLETLLLNNTQALHLIKIGKERVILISSSANQSNLLLETTINSLDSKEENTSNA